MKDEQTPAACNADTTISSAADTLLIDGPTLARVLSVSLGTVHAMRRAAKLPLRIVRLSGCVRFDRREVERWVAAGCPGTSKWNAMNMIAGRRSIRDF